MGYTAIILGASGLTGNLLLKKLINDDRYVSIKLFLRSKIENLPNKVTQHIGDLIKLEDFKEVFTGDHVFCCIGTTAKKTPNKSLYKQIDHGIPTTAARLCKENNIFTYLVVSAMGASIKSTIFYNKVKGEMERDVLLKNIENTFILRPSLISGKRNESRFLEKIGLIIFKIIQPLLFGKYKEYKITKALDIVEAMIYLANKKYITKEKIITSNIIKQITITK